MVSSLSKGKFDFQRAESEALSCFLAAKFPQDSENQILRELERLQKTDNLAQAVRSSGLEEDGSKNSFAGRHDSFFSKLDDKSAIEYIKRCYASLFSAVALQYRFQHNFGLPQGMAVVIQNLKQFQTGFVAYTAAPGNYDISIIEAAPGHCKSVVDGRPVDSFKVDRYGRKKSEKINKNKDKMWQYDTTTNSLVLVNSPSVVSSGYCLSDVQIRKIASVTRDVEQFYILDFGSRKPQDIEGGFDYAGKLWITQSRDITGMDFTAPDIILPNLSKILAQSQSVGNR